MEITAKTRTYSFSKGGMHYYSNGKHTHRITGPAVIRSTYYRSWYHKYHSPHYFQKTGPGVIHLDGASDSYHIDGKCCSKEEYEDHCKNQKL